MSISLEHAGAILTIDLDAICANYRLLRSRFGGAEVACVVKADAYGLGADRIAPALARAGCGTFYVALVDEAIRLRGGLGEAAIHVLGGILPGTLDAFAEYRLMPTLNSLADVEAWAAVAAGPHEASAADLHIDTGMNRLGLPGGEFDLLCREPDRLGATNVATVMSHLACAEEAEHPLNRRQLEDFTAARAALAGAGVGAGAQASLVNSSGIFLRPEFHFDVARPGIALYGGNPTPGKPNPMAQVVLLQGKILQVRDVDTPQTVGYGATHRITRRGKIATVALGYADGFLRSSSNTGSGYIGDIRVPIVGRVSMDLITFDVSAVPDHLIHPGALIDMIGPENPIDRVAADAGTIGYEILTSLGARYHRVYAGTGGS